MEIILNMVWDNAGRDLYMLFWLVGAKSLVESCIEQKT